jgi:branched-chain amino acid transport system substrate-binding protein
MRSSRLLALIGVVTLTSTSCGLMSRSAGDLSRGLSASGGAGANNASGLGGVNQSGGGVASGAGGPTVIGNTSSASGSGTSGSNASGGTGTATSGGASTGGGGSSATGSGSSSGQAPYERIGIRNGVIYLGIHAPETGAAPIPLQAFVTGTKLFWENHTVFGHHVVMQFTDDQYRPDVARQVCESMSRQDFLVIGGAGTDQIQACATDPVLAASHTPYFSAGVTTNGLVGLPDYFAISQTYAAQSTEVFGMASNLYSADVKKKWAIVTEGTHNFDDATASMQHVLTSEGVPYCTIRPPKYYSDSDVSSTVSQAASCGAKVVYLDVDPNFWIAMVRDASSQLFFPDWVGPGITNGEDIVATPVCGEQANIHAAFLSPYMGLDRAPSDFSSESNPSPDTPAAERDIELLIYGTSQVVYNALLSVGSYANLTRDNLIAATTHFSASYGRQLTVFPNVSMGAGGGHFGGAGAWELQLSCSRNEYLTAGRL